MFAKDPNCLSLLGSAGTPTCRLPRRTPLPGRSAAALSDPVSGDDGFPRGFIGGPQAQSSEKQVPSDRTENPKKRGSPRSCRGSRSPSSSPISLMPLLPAGYGVQVLILGGHGPPSLAHLAPAGPLSMWTGPKEGRDELQRAESGPRTPHLQVTCRRHRRRQSRQSRRRCR